MTLRCAQTWRIQPTDFTPLLRVKCPLCTKAEVNQGTVRCEALTELETTMPLNKPHEMLRFYVCTRYFVRLKNGNSVVLAVVVGIELSTKFENSVQL